MFLSSSIFSTGYFCSLRHSFLHSPWLIRLAGIKEASRWGKQGIWSLIETTTSKSSELLTCLILRTRPLKRAQSGWAEEGHLTIHTYLGGSQFGNVMSYVSINILVSVFWGNICSHFSWICILRSGIHESQDVGAQKSGGTNLPCPPQHLRILVPSDSCQYSFEPFRWVQSCLN